MKKQKTTSIILRINRHIQWPKFFRMLGADLFTALAVIAAWCAAIETRYGRLIVMRARWIEFETNDSTWHHLPDVTYNFALPGTDKILSADIGQIFRPVAAGLLIVLILQLIGWSIGWARNGRFLRRALRPLNDAAMEAQRIAENGINEQQLQNMERAIDSVTDSKDSVHIGDADLQGVETAINKLLQRLKDSYEEQTRFVDDASHELRTPIAVIHGYSSILDRWGKEDPATLDEAVKAILEESEHMQMLIDQLLFLARGDGGRQPLNMELSDANELLREITDESRMVDNEHEYVFREGAPVPVTADDAMLKQAVRILTDNAAKYTPKGGSITLWAEKREDGSVGLSVQDQGIGLSQEEASHMFERFFRGSEVRGSTKGSGLGLSIAKWIVDRHDGHIEVLGYAGIGTRMTICLPAASEE